MSIVAALWALSILGPLGGGGKKRMAAGAIPL